MISSLARAVSGKGGKLILLHPTVDTLAQAAFFVRSAQVAPSFRPPNIIFCIVVWHYLPAKWNGQEAADTYSVIAKVVKKHSRRRC